MVETLGQFLLELSISIDQREWRRRCERAANIHQSKLLELLEY